MHYLSQGKRGMLYVMPWHGRKAVVKIKNPRSKAPHAIEREAFWLKKVNTKGIGPRLYFHDNEKVIMEYISGVPIGEYLKHHCVQPWIVENVIEQCFALDALGINKLEMHKPVKHVILSGKRAVLVDFERCRETRKPKNVTQWCQYVQNILGFKKPDAALKTLLQEYKRAINRETFFPVKKRLLSLVSASASAVRRRA